MKMPLTMAGSLLAALAADAAALNRDELAQKLQALEKAPAPTKLAPGAMCYKPAGLQARQEYVCPTCGQKTVYAVAQNRTAILALRQTDTYRRQIKEIQALGLPCSLDETAFCQNCGKDAQTKGFFLVIAWPDRTVHRVQLHGNDDLLLVLEFLQGKTTHDAGMGGEKPLKEFLPRIHELLGIEPPPATAEKTP